jgi:hypothetical protein
MLYSAILNSNTVVAEYSEDQGDFQSTMIKILKHNRQPIEFYMVPYSSYEFYFLHKDNYTLACITQLHLDNEKILNYLQELRDGFNFLLKSEKDNLVLKCTNLIKSLMVYIILLILGKIFSKFTCR